MTALLVSCGYFLLLALIALPGLAAVARARATVFAGLFYAGLGIALGAYHLGLPKQAPADLLRPPPTMIGADGSASELCARVLEQVRRARIIIDRPDARRVRVSRDDWAVLPEQVKQAITGCLAAPTRPGAPAQEIEIVQIETR